MSIYIAISTQDQAQNINELTSVYDYFDGICAVDHFSKDETFNILNSRKKNGFVEQIPYYGHHAHDLNHILFNPKIKVGDWILLRDSAERINTDFAANIKPFIKMLENNEVNTVYQYSKLLLFRRFPHQYFNSTPHWGFHGGQNKMIGIENQNWFTDEKEYCYSVRNETRDKYHFIDAFMRYYLMIDSNHNLLGLENFGKVEELFPLLENQRLAFLAYLQILGLNNDVVSLKNWFQSKEEGWCLPDTMRSFINSVLVINQFYRYHVLNDLTVSPDIAAPIVKIS